MIPTEIRHRFANLTPEQRARLRGLLKETHNVTSRRPLMPRAPLSGSVPLSPQQRRLWTIAKLSPESTAYNIPAVFRMVGKLDVNALIRALATMMARHEILRTVIREDEAGEPHQHVLPDQPVVLHQRNLGRSAARPEDEAVQQAIREAVNVPLDFVNGPLWRSTLIRVASEEKILVLSMHHIISDGWSLGIFMRELFGYYERYTMRCEDELTPLPIQYADYSLWQNECLSSDRRAVQASFWRQHLADAPGVVEMPLDATRHTDFNRRGAIHTLVLPHRIFERARDLAKLESATPFHLFLAALNALIARYIGQTDIVLGIPVSGRDFAETHPLIGIFVNTLPVRLRFSPATTFRVLLQKAREVFVAALEHSELPFDAIVEAVNPERVPGCNPLFQILYTYQNKIEPLALSDLRIDYEMVDTGTAKFDLSLDIFESPDGLSCLFEYDSQLMSAARVGRLAEHFKNLVDVVLTDPDKPLVEIEFLTEQERALALASIQAEKNLPGPMTFNAIFAANAMRAPQNTAVIDSKTTIYYGALYDRAGKLAYELAQQGVGRGAIVAVCLPRTTALIEMLVAVLHAGAAFVAIDPDYPCERRNLICVNAGATLVVTEQALLSSLTGLGVPVVVMEELAQKLGEQRLAPVAVAPTDLAYLIYTSGTTGQPKGVAVTQRGWINALYGWTQAYELGARVHTHLQMASIGFDVFCGDLIRALGSGGALVICPHHLLGDAEALYELLLRERIDCAEFVPAVFRNLATWLSANGKRLDLLRILIVASDSWYVEEYRSFQALCGADTRLINSYGTAEATIDSTWFEAALETLNYASPGQLVPIGKPFPNVEALVLDADLRPLPPGVPGEICIGGYGLASGYIDNPELTSARFVPHPYSVEPGARLYRTGDIGCLRADGIIELIGRRDHQVKIRGQRIELGEIENVLSTHPAVAQAVATVREENPGDKRLIAYYLIADSALAPNDVELYDHMRMRLPTYMVPSAFVALEALPLSANGKVNRSLLPKPSTSHRSIEQTFVSPRTLTEEMLTSIWCQVMRIPRVGVYDSFFELGGHSLLALNIISRARKVFRVELPLHALFTHPTIAALAQLIAVLQGTTEVYSETLNTMPVIVPEPQRRHEPFPLTEVQQAYWLGRNELFEFGNVTTHSYDELETVNLDVRRFDSAWNTVIKRHDMLRAVVREDGLQQILPQVPHYSVPVLDLRHATTAEVDSAITQVRTEMSHQMLDVHRWPVFDVRVTLLPGNKARLHFSTDALVFDAWSFVIIVEDLVRFYIDEAALLHPLDLSFRDYVLAENALYTGERYQRALEYWRTRITDLPPAPELPMAMNPAQLKKPRFTRIHRKLEPEAWDRLKLKATKAGITATGIMLAAYAEVLTRFARAPRFSLNLTFLNRHPLHPQVNDIVGEFTSLTLLSVDNTGTATFIERARKIQSDLWHDLEHHYISGVQVLRDLTRATGGATRAKMPVVFTSALVVPIPKRNPSFPVTPVYRDGVTQTSQVWLDCGVWEDDRWLLCNWDVVVELYPEGFVQQMVDAFWTLVCRLADEEDIWHQSVPDIAPLPAGYRPARPQADVPGVTEETLVSLFLKQVAAHPARAAVVTPTQQLSYGELAEHVAWVCGKLIGNGVGKGELVAVLLNRGWEQAAATLGIMTAGAAYLPIDPDLPLARIRYLLEQGGVRQVITQPDLALRLQDYGDLSAQVLTPSCRAPAESLDTALLPGPADLAYVIFTSGSTGQPKGVMIEHQGAVNTIIDINKRFAITAEDRVLAVSSLSFDLSVYDLFGLFAAGAAVVFPEHERRLDPRHWVDLIEEHHITLWNSVPALMGLLSDYAGARHRALPMLKQVLLSGDWIPLHLPERIRAVAPEAAVAGLGGATEASIWSILYPIGTIDPSWTSIPYGQAMEGQVLYVFNHRLEPCPTWVTGDLYIGGAGLARGYWRDPARTAAAFVIHPHTGERLYRTGDLGRWLPDGNIEFQGRADFQVKVQGHRIELNEIEITLMAHPHIKEAVVNAVGEARGEKRLIGYLVPKSGVTLNVEAVRQHLRLQLPEYMVPQAYLTLERLPLSANGKVDRKVLPLPGDYQFGERIEYIAPRTAQEESLRRIWSDLLRVERIGVLDNFFETGGDSMLAVHLLVRVGTELGGRLTLREIFLHPTIAALSVILERSEPAPASLITLP